MLLKVSLYTTRRLSSSSLRNNFKPSFNVEKIPDLKMKEHVDLEWKQWLPNKVKLDKRATPVLFLHGLYGGKASFNKVGRNLSEHLVTPVYSVDLRNHGDSPHALPHSYMSMAHDVARFIQERQWANCVLVGHSMGAKVAMLVSLLHPDLISKLVVMDNTPHSKPLGRAFYESLLGMCELEAGGIDFGAVGSPPALGSGDDHRRKQVTKTTVVDEFLSKYEKDASVRQLLLSNFRYKWKGNGITSDGKHGEAFQIPVLNFWKHDVIDAMSSWPVLEVAQFTKPVLVMYGKESSFVKERYRSIFEEYFTDLEFVGFDTGHWIYSEQPAQCTKVLSKFISG
ncbi:uncharacterized protein LODBEIA_P44030 [Lodderomyces beijingensis]|uniref:AB hydrolase-1 domain-containing protein n=1 Tax=Lodderomyces beijingensis TaxID=1775926 RepID=A0ABP0ZPV6_9ASCO